MLNYRAIFDTSAEQGFRQCSPITQSLHWSHLNKGFTNPVTMLPNRKNYKCSIMGFCVLLLVQPSRAQTSEILWKTQGIHDFEHSEGGVYVLFKWDLCSDPVIGGEHSRKPWCQVKWGTNAEPEGVHQKLIYSLVIYNIVLIKTNMPELKKSTLAQSDKPSPIVLSSIILQDVI